MRRFLAFACILLAPSGHLLAAQQVPNGIGAYEAQMIQGQRAFETRDFTGAAVAADSALHAIRPLDDPQREISARLLLAAAHIAQGTDAANRTAGYAMDSAVAAVERARRRAQTPEERLAVLESQSLVMDFWVRGIFSRGGSGDFSVDDAFYATLAAADRGRARVLADVVGAEDRSAVSPADLVPDGQRLHALAASTNASVISYLVTADRLLIWFSGPNGSLNFTSAVITDSALTKLVVEAREALGVDAAADTAARTMVSALEGARGVRGVRPAGGDPAALRRLAEVLLPQRILNALAEAARRDVVIIPHRAVSMVPFAALPIGDASRSAGVIFAFRYAPSLSVLEAVERRPAVSLLDTTQVRRGLVVGDPAMPQVGDVLLEPLPGARREAAWLAERLGISAVTGAAATESLLRRDLGQATLVHLATHGFAYADPLRERESFVALAPDESHDGLLTVGEIEEMPGRIAADLVVLSACQTGLGSTRLSEGTIGLPRALLGAGARTVLVSLWSVNDEATELLMQRFYHHWLEGGGQRTKAQALWRAQNDVRADARFALPRYWAAFQLVGGN